MPQLHSWNNMQKRLRPQQDTNLQPSDPESYALSTRPRGHLRATAQTKFTTLQKMKCLFQEKKTSFEQIFLELRNIFLPDT